MDIVTVALACSLYPDAALVETIVRDASRGNAYFVGDAVKMDTYDQAKALAQAKRTIAHVVTSGGRPVVGMMGIPLTWAARLGKSEDELFDACSNVAVGTAMLAQFEGQCRASLVGQQPTKKRSRPRFRRLALARESLRRCVLGHFGRELGIKNFVDGIMVDIPPTRFARAATWAIPSRTAATTESEVLLDGDGSSQPENRSLFFHDPPSLPPTSRFPAPDDDRSPILR